MSNPDGGKDDGDHISHDGDGDGDGGGHFCNGASIKSYSCDSGLQV